VDGDDAVRQFMRHRDEIGFLLLDMVMPGKNGSEAYEEIRKVKPDVKALFAGGHNGDVIHNKRISDEEIDYISKPLTPNELLKRVREALDMQIGRREPFLMA
jgi:two-component system, cell cycle sensor histidine kinase and response regulator CckA